MPHIHLETVTGWWLMSPSMRVAGDVLTRWHRQRGERVHFLTGTDEHGEKVLQAAQSREMTPEMYKAVIHEAHQKQLGVAAHE